MAYALNVFVLFNKGLPEAMAQEAASFLFKDIVKRKPELAQIVNSLPEDAMMNLQHDFSDREMAKDEFQKAAANQLAQWAIGQTSSTGGGEPFVQSSSFQAVGQDGERIDALYAIAVVAA